MTTYRFVQTLPDLISSSEYEDDPNGETVRLRIQVTPDGVEVLGDAMRPRAIEALLEGLELEEIEQMLCG